MAPSLLMPATSNQYESPGATPLANVTEVVATVAVSVGCGYTTREN